MNWSRKPHPLETFVEWAAPIPLTIAVFWAANRFGLSLTQAAGLGTVMLAAGVAAMKAAGSPPVSCFAGGAAHHEAGGEVLGELLLEAKDEVLMLDDPLTSPSEDSRVVRLFSRGQATPGELVERIGVFLDEVRRPSPSAEATTVAQRPGDASAALHAALANIRASLR